MCFILSAHIRREALEVQHRPAHHLIKIGIKCVCVYYLDLSYTSRFKELKSPSHLAHS